MAERAPTGESERKKGKEPDDPKADKADKNGNGRVAPPAPPAPDSKTASRGERGSLLPPPAPPPRPSPKPKSGDAPHPSIPPLPAAGPWRSYKEIVAGLASRIVEAQRPIRVLQAIRWDGSIEEDFRKNRFRELPKVDPEYYAKQDLGFDPKAKAAEFEEIAHDIDREMGESDAIGNIMASTALEYRDVVRMLDARGTPLFYGYSRKLYGSCKDKFPDGKTSLRDLGHLLYEILTNIDETLLGMSYERNIEAADAAAELNRRFTEYFGDSSVRVEVD